MQVYFFSCPEDHPKARSLFYATLPRPPAAPEFTSYKARSLLLLNKNRSSLFEPLKFTLFSVHLEDVIKNLKFSLSMMETLIYFQESTWTCGVRKKEVHER